MRQLLARCFWSLVLIAGFSAATPTPADQKESPPQSSLELQADPSQAPPLITEDYGQAFFKMLLTLFGLLILIILTIWVLKRLSHGKLGGINKGKTIQILEKRAISAKSALYLIEVEGTRLVVAESQLEVRPLHSWPVEPGSNEMNN